MGKLLLLGSVVLAMALSTVGCGASLRGSVSEASGPDYLAEIRNTCEHGPAHRTRAVGRPMVSPSGVEVRCF